MVTFFQEWGTYIFGGEILKPFKLNYNPGLTELNSIRFILFDILPSKFRDRSDLKIVSSRNDMKRVGIRYNIDLLKKKHNCNPKVCLIFEYAQLMFKYMELSRDI